MVCSPSARSVTQHMYPCERNAAEACRPPHGNVLPCNCFYGTRAPMRLVVGSGIRRPTWRVFAQKTNRASQLARESRVGPLSVVLLSKHVSLRLLTPVLLHLFSTSVFV